MGTPYFAPGYFAGAYPPDFYAPAPGSSTSPAAVVPLSDSGCLVWLKQLLEGLGVFELVHVGRILPRTNDQYPFCGIFPVGFEESDDVDPFELVRVLGFEVSILIRPPDSDDQAGAFTLLDGLANAVSNAVGSSPPPGSVPGLTAIRSGSYRHLSDSHDGSIGLTLTGQVAYLVTGKNGRAEPSDDD